MRSLLGPLLNQAPVPLAVRRSRGGSMLGAGATTTGFEAQLRSFLDIGGVGGQESEFHEAPMLLVRQM